MREVARPIYQSRETGVIPTHTPRVHFADHYEGQRLNQAYDDLRARGLLGASVWPEAAIADVRNLAPEIITADSQHLTPILADPPSVGERMIVDQEIGGMRFVIPATGAWVRSPGDPSQLNPTRRAWLVFADQLAQGAGISPELGLNRIIRDRLVGDDLSLRNSLAKTLTEKNKKKIGPGFDSAKLHAKEALVGAVLLGGSAYKWRAQHSSSVSRRELLAGASLMGLGLISYAVVRGGNKISPMTALDVTDRLKKLKDEEIVGEELIKARNAMLILKTKDAAERITGIEGRDLAPPTILLGTAHAIGINELLKSDQSCKKALNEYVRSLYAVIDKYAREVDPTLDAEIAKKLLRAQLIYVGVVQFGQGKETGTVINKPPDEVIIDRVASTDLFVSERTSSALVGIE